MIKKFLPSRRIFPPGFIFVDESGTLPDPKDKIIVIAAVATPSPEKIEAIFKTLIKKRGFKRPSGELKFYTAGEKTKDLFFHWMAKEDFAVFILVVEKSGQKITDSPENFAILCWLVLTDVLAFYPEPTEIVFDRHFSAKKDMEKFNKILAELLGKNLRIVHVDSQHDKRVNIADMVAGAILAKESGKNKNFYQIIEKEVIISKLLSWPEAKRKFFDKKRLAQTDASAHLSK